MPDESLNRDNFADLQPAKGDATDRITSAITQDILSGGFAPGQHLLENSLSRQLSVNRNTLREAMKRLAAENIVTLSHYRGAFVDILDRQAALDLLNASELLACACRSVGGRRMQ